MPRVRLTIDPNGEIVPTFEEVRAGLAGRLKEGETEDGVIEELKANWEAARQQRIAQWAEQVQEDEEERRREEEATRLEEEEIRKAKEKKLEEERAKIEAAKPKVKSIARNKHVDTVSAPTPSAFAVNKVKATEYVELHYFTPESCKEAREQEFTISQDSLAATHINNQFVLQPVAAHRPSSKVVADAQLSWRQVSIAKTALIECMRKSESWPEDHITSLETFFYQLDNSPLRRQELGEEAIIEYQAQVRQEWHRDLKAPGGDQVFDIGDINEEKLNRIHAKIIVEKQAEGLRAVRA
ncbi:hypothetical protein FA15DRAFT_720637 [Coprinopsis marcescibilis]|uniref:Uncharacterized protein n=1 Tax=Coprinopsis marcescibilis TaxID=230819 RepID=A0A5C3KJN6_COPMA|nr:hypothetical protein FA15DRAFT_720637 [Coprinopsis marcescibilis]